MTIASYFLGPYFAAILGISGLAKLAQPSGFSSTLERQRILPAWSIPAVSHVVPWLEVGTAILLLAGVARSYAAALVLALFVVFLGVEATLVVTKRSDECGCYGIAHPQAVDSGSVMTSLLLIILAGAHLWLVTHSTPMAWGWRVMFAIPVVALCFLVAGRLIQRRWRESRQTGQIVYVSRELDTVAGGYIPVVDASNLKADDSLPIDLGISLPHRAILLFVSHGCRYCVELCRALESIDLGAWSLIIAVTGQEPLIGSSAPNDLVLPPRALQLDDPERTWFRALGLRGTPTALSFVDGKLANQQAGATVAWFAGIPFSDLERVEPIAHVEIAVA